MTDDATPQTEAVIAEIESNLTERISQAAVDVVVRIKLIAHATALERQLRAAQDRLSEFEQEPSAWIDPAWLNRGTKPYGNYTSPVVAYEQKEWTPLYARKAKG